MELYDYQIKVAELIQSGQSVILQAPTGAGKTIAALWPYLESWDRNEPTAFPRKCIYSVPMKVLANQFVDQIDRMVKEEMILSDLPEITIQTGDNPKDTKFEGDLIFTTIDQTLSSFLNIPYGLGNRLANLNAGAVMSSYLVFDELHLYDPDTTLPTTLEMLKMLKGITPFVVMTATFSSSMLQDLADMLGAVVVPNPDQPTERTAMEAIGSQVGKDRRFYAKDEELTAVSVLAHNVPRTICICNTVHSAQKLYDDLHDELAQRGDTETELRLLHSRFYKADRQEKEQWIRDGFKAPKKAYTGKRLIQIATQVIEVGVDATCDLLHTELAPASSLLQRAGRCARREHERGRVLIYLPRDEEGEPNFSPYFLASKPEQTKRGRQLCETTWTAVNTPSFTDTHMSFSQEQALIDIVHTPVDQAIMRELSHVSHDRRDKMLHAMREQDRGLVSELIRDVDNRFVFVHPDPTQDEKLLTNPWAYEGFGLYPNMVFSAYKTLFEEVDSDTPWMMKGMKPVTDDEAPARQKTQYKWWEIEEGDVYKTAVIAIHPHLVQYDKERGFRFALSHGTHRSPESEKKKGWERYSYQRETYVEHVAGLYAAYQGHHKPLKDEIAFVVHRLEQLPHYKLATGQIDQILRVMFACHDLGKLDVKWQAWAHSWQKEAVRFYGDGVVLEPSYMAAHTDYDPADKVQREAQKKVTPKRPNHAGESAIAGARVFQALCKGNVSLLKAALTAIARHHTPQTDSYKSYSLHTEGKVAFQEALRETSLDLTLSELVLWQSNGKEALPRMMIHFNSSAMSELLLYFLLVRVLRLADQRSQVKGR